MLQQELEVAPCDPASWSPGTAGLCDEPCVAHRADPLVDGAAFVWTEVDPLSGGSALHMALLHCRRDHARGLVQHMWLPAAAEAGGWPVRSESLLEERQPIPLVAGAEELARWKSQGWTLFVDRHESGDTAIELLELELWSRSWLPRRGLEVAGGGPAVRVFVRRSELCIAALGDDAEGDLLITAYTGNG